MYRSSAPIIIDPVKLCRLQVAKRKQSVVMIMSCSDCSMKAVIVALQIWVTSSFRPGHRLTIHGCVCYLPIWCNVTRARDTELANFPYWVLCPEVWRCQGDEYEDCNLGIHRRGCVARGVHHSNCTSRWFSHSQNAQEAVAKMSSDHDMRHGIGIGCS